MSPEELAYHQMLAKMKLDASRLKVDMANRNIYQNTKPQDEVLKYRRMRFPDYDLDSYIRKYGAVPNQSQGQHLTDEFKLPNHITFSDDSIYSSKQHMGGKWVESSGQWHYYPSDFVLKMYTPEQLTNYFNKYEKNAILHIPSDKNR